MRVERIGRREIEQSPSHELDQFLKDVPGVQLFRRSDARSGHPTSQGVTFARSAAMPRAARFWCSTESRRAIRSGAG